MKYILFISIALISCLISSCNEKKEDFSRLIAPGNRMYGGELKFMSTQKVTSLIPHESSRHYSSRIISQLFDPLLILNTKTMNAAPSVAESYNVSNNAMIYTFKIRKGIFFHEDNCFNNKPHELNAHDAKFTLDLACSGLKINTIDYLLVNRIKGAKYYNNNTVKKFDERGVSGITVIDEYTLQIELNSPFFGFEKILTHPSLGIFPKEAYEKYGKKLKKHAVGSGPFVLEKITDKGLKLKRNKNYWKKDRFGNQLPFISNIEITYTKNKRLELLAFRNSKIDLVLDIPVEEIEFILGTLIEAQEGKNIIHKVKSTNSLNMSFIAMDCQSNEFSDLRVRKAFNLAINRETIINSNLEGEGWSATNGFVPSMLNYPNEKVIGHKYDVNLAKVLMAKAGYPNGENFPTLDLYVNTTKESSAYKLCQGIVDQLKRNLNVNLKIKLCTTGERKEAIKTGEAKIWRSGWIADYPDAENFLSLFYSGNIKPFANINLFKFKNKAFDSLFENAISEKDIEKRTDLLVKCDQMIIDQAALMPILTKDYIILINGRIKNFQVNSMESLNITESYIK